MPFDFSPTEIPDVIEIQPQLFADERGVFAELFKLEAFSEIGVSTPLTQVNYSRSNKNVLRGMHYQLKPKAQAKLVSCSWGEVFDVAVDIRQGSPTFGKWVGRTLSAQKKNMLYVPHGFAHGFCTLSDEAEVVYFCDEQYSPEHEGGLVWNDPEVAIEWPIDAPILADRDAAFPKLEEIKNTFTYE